LVFGTSYLNEVSGAIEPHQYSLETGAAQPLASQIKDPDTAAMIKMLTDLDAVRQKQSA
jgi:hypothetical protein